MKKMILLSLLAVSAGQLYGAADDARVSDEYSQMVQIMERMNKGPLSDAEKLGVAVTSLALNKVENLLQDLSVEDVRQVYDRELDMLNLTMEMKGPFDGILPKEVLEPSKGRRANKAGLIKNALEKKLGIASE